MKKFLILTITLFLILSILFSITSCSFVIPNEDFSGLKSDFVGENSVLDTDNTIDSEESSVSTDSFQNDSTNTDDVLRDDCSVNGHCDDDKNYYCDKCNSDVVVTVDFYAINDLHGKFCDSKDQPGVDELGTFFELKKQEDEHIVLLSSGDMWQGSAESVLSYGKIMIDWMNELGFVSMTLGNHEFDWGEDVIKDNALIANFPFLAINVYNNSTGKLAEYCTPSVIVNRGDIQIGIIGAIGDCYSSISSDMVEDVSFKTGYELTMLVREEAQRLRNLGVDLIVYSIHDGLENGSNSLKHYDANLSNGYVDIVFEGHTHQAYIENDSKGVVHIQGGAENYGMSHIEISVNSVTGEKSINQKNLITSDTYAKLDDHLPTEIIEDNYADIIEYAYTTLGYASKKYYSDEVAEYVAELYLKAGLEKWGEQYDIALGGGYLQTRSPYDLSSGAVNYANILSLLPFNNRIVLCKVSGSKLDSQFINSSNRSYHVALNDSFSTADLDSYATYYIVVDMYTALYKYNGLTIIDYYDHSTYARDLFAQAVKDGELGSAVVDKPDNEYTFTSITQALEIGQNLNIGQEASGYFYFKGTLQSFANLTYGNCYLTDESGEQIYIYGLSDSSGGRYDGMSNPPVEGDTVILRANIKKYKYSSGEVIVELINSVVLEVNPQQ